MKFKLKFKSKVYDNDGGWSLNIKFEIEVLRWNLKLKFKVWNWSLKFKFDVEVWSLSLTLKF